MEYKDMYQDAIENTDCDGEYHYDGYKDVSALIMYVYDKYSVNTAGNDTAHNELCKLLQETNN